MANDIGSYKFETKLFFPEDIFYKIIEVRLSKVNEILKEEYKNRVKRKYPWNNNLVMIAADHPARGVTKIGQNIMAMGDRHEYLGRILRVLTLDHVDGIMTTPDIMDDLFIMNYLFKQLGGKSFLDTKILIGSTNRGGLLGSPYEMYDPVTAYTIDDIRKLKLDGAKMMVRLDFETKMAKYSQRTLVLCSKMIRRCNESKIPSFIEALPVTRDQDSNYTVNKNAESMIKTIGIATALGGGSVNTWLKVPYVDKFESVAKSATNPILILGGESTGNPIDLFKILEMGLAAGKNVKGCLAGRNLLYPGDDDPRAVALSISGIIHDKNNTDKAIKILNNNRGRQMDVLTSKFNP
ncbi:2-amino-3,7-dideoxy-D-threo-hept-6-ulosonate synthase [subsurface metagenome]